MSKAKPHIKLENVAKSVKDYVLPALVGLISATAAIVTAYASMNFRIDALITKVDAQEVDIAEHKNTCSNQYEQLLQDNAAMDAKINYIYDWVKELRSNN